MAKIFSLSFRHLLSISIFVQCVCILGCGIRVGEVTGTVTIHGEPAPEGLRVMFQAKDSDAETIYANTGVGGRYQLIHRSGKKGIEPGVYLVSIDFWSEKAFRPPELKNLEIPQNFRDANSSLLCTVPSGGIEFDIAVE